MVAKAALTAQHCRHIAGVWHLVADPALVCYEGSHTTVAVFSWAAIVIFVLGIPALALLAVYLYRRRLALPAVQKALGFLLRCVVLRCRWVRREWLVDVFRCCLCCCCLWWCLAARNAQQRLPHSLLGGVCQGPHSRSDLRWVSVHSIVGHCWQPPSPPSHTVPR